VNLAKFSDDLWIGVKGQSNPVIAGSSRNAFGCSVGRMDRGRALFQQGGHQLYQIDTNSEFVPRKAGSETAGDKLRSREGNSPDRQIRRQTNS
jgi:hypothetical protein